MACHIMNREEQAERYVAGLLSESEREACELHFFNCSPCLAVVREAEALTDALAEPGIAAARPAATWMRLAATAAVVVAASLLTLHSSGRFDPAPVGAPRRAPVPANPYAALAAFEPPSPPSVRLRDAMPTDLGRGFELYRRRDFGGAVQALQTAARTTPGAAAPFFLGISLLVTGETDQGIAALQAAVGRGDSPYLEEAHLYLARAHFAKGDFGAAERELEATIALGGARGEEARGLLEKSRSHRPTSGR